MIEQTVGNDRITMLHGELARIIRGLRRLVFFLSMAAATVASGRAGGQTDPEMRARELYAVGEYEEALAIYGKLYAETMHPTYLRNLGRCQQMLGWADKAINSFREYLRKATGVTAKERTEIEGFIAEMEALQRKQRDRTASSAKPPPPPRAPPAARPPSADTAVATTPVSTTPVSTTPAWDGGILEISLGPRFLSRSFDYTSSATAAPGYHLTFTPVVGGRLSLFPGARTQGLFAHLGLLAMVEAATWIRSGIFPTGTSDVVVGAQGRVPGAFGQLSASVAFFRHAFVLKDTPDPGDQARLSVAIPNTTYVGARFGLEGRFNLGGRVVLGLDAGYRWVTNPGEGRGLVRSPEYFQDATVSYALDAGASLGVRFAWCQARVGVDHRRYAFGALRGATLDAPGGTDVYTAISLSVMGEFGAADRRP